jgi:hypothetical protein
MVKHDNIFLMIIPVDMQMIHKLAESPIVTGKTIATPAENQMIHMFLESIFPKYDCTNGTCSLLVHALTTTNVNHKNMVSVT